METQVHTTPLGIAPFGVFIDSSPELEQLTACARSLRSLPFSDKLHGIIRLASGAMQNAYEQWQRTPESPRGLICQDIVMQGHPLSYALHARAGCCRYQGALFFALGFEAGLGTRHFLQQAPLNQHVRTVFNDVYDEAQLHHISIFRETLQDPAHDYARNNPALFESAIGFPFPEQNPSPRFDTSLMLHFSYHTTPEGMCIIGRPGQHLLSIPSLTV